MRPASKNQPWHPISPSDATSARPIDRDAILALRHTSGTTAWFYEAVDLREAMRIEPPLGPEAKLLLLENVPDPQGLAVALSSLVMLPDLPQPLFVAVDEGAAEALAIARRDLIGNMRRLEWRDPLRRAETRLFPLDRASRSDEAAALQRSLSQRPTYLEGEKPGHLEGRAAWFARRHGRTG